MRRTILSDSLVGILWMLLASTLFAAGNAFVKALSPRVPFWEAVFARSIFALVAVALANVRRPHVFVGVNKRALFVRGLFGTAALTCYYYAISRTQLGVAVMLAHTSPLFVALLASVFLRERIRPALLGLVVVGFGGVALIVSPNLSSVDAHAMVALVAALLAAGAYTTLRHLRRTDEPVTIVFYYALFSTLGSLPFFVATFRMPSGPDLALLVGVGLTATVAQFGLTYAYRHAAAAVVSPFSYWTVLVSFVYGVALFGEVPTATAIIGSVIVCASGIGIGFAERRGVAPDGDHAAIEDARKL